MRIPEKRMKQKKTRNIFVRTDLHLIRFTISRISGGDIKPGLPGYYLFFATAK